MPRRVLVVEDDVDAADITGMIVESFGHVCRIAHTGREAIEIARDLRPDIVMLDIGLPDRSGFEIARMLREGPDGAAIYLVALTGYAEDDNRAHALAAGFDGYLVKPITIATIAQALSSAAPRAPDRSLRSPMSRDPDAPPDR